MHPVLTLMIVLSVLLTALWLSSVAGRLDRVHVRRDMLRESLKLQLAWRESASARIVAAGVLPTELAQRLEKALTESIEAANVSFDEYVLRESEITAVLAEAFEDIAAVEQMCIAPNVRELCGDLAHACRRVMLARRFHNDAVGAAQLLHRRTIVRVLKLAGHTPFPTTVDLDDTVPPGLENL